MHPNKYRRNENSQTRKSNSALKFILTLFVLGLFAIGGAALWYTKGVSTSLSESEEVVFVNVKEGENRDQIAQKLIDLGILEDSKLFILYTKISGQGSQIKAGNHIIPRNVNIKELVTKLEEVPDETTIWVTIPEGLRYDEIAEIISKGFAKADKSVFDKSIFLQMSENPHDQELENGLKEFISSNIPRGKSIEGFLYPDTYNFNIDASTNEVFSMLVKTFKTKVENTDYKSSSYSLYEIINIAAMLEREAFNPQEADMIADIIIRRLEMGYYLGIDATSLYHLKDWKATLTYKELADSNPYNTRKNLGLPPTPISNPGIQTIKSVINPKPNEYLYYLHDMEGRIHYGKTNSDHENNKAKYL